MALLERAERELVSGGGASGEGEKKVLGLGLGLWVEDGDLGWTDVMAAPCECFNGSSSPLSVSFH